MPNSFSTLTNAQREEIAADMHILVRDRLRAITSAEPRLEDVGLTMACAFGDACGLLAMNGLGSKIPELNAQAEHSAERIMRSLAEVSCEGRA